MMSKRKRNRDGVWKALNAQDRSGSHTETRLRSIHPPRGPEKGIPVAPSLA
jgi:hypothetical protein